MKANTGHAVRAGLSMLASLARPMRSRPASARDGPGFERTLAGMTVASFIDDPFEQVEPTGPCKAVEAARARTVVASPHGGQARPEQFDALLLHIGGMGDPDLLRTNDEAPWFVRAFFDAESPSFPTATSSGLRPHPRICG